MQTYNLKNFTWRLTNTKESKNKFSRQNRVCPHARVRPPLVAKVLTVAFSSILYNLEGYSHRCIWEKSTQCSDAY